MKPNKKLILSDQILIAFFAMMGIVLKPIISPIVNLITDPIHITGGSTGGGIYMLIIVLAGLLIPSPFTCTKVGIIQGILSLTLGITSFQGFFAIFIYTCPGIVADLILNLSINQESKAVLACIGANLTGSLITNFIFFHLPLIPFTLMVLLGILSAFCGGLGANFLFRRLEKIRLSLKN